MILQRSLLNKYLSRQEQLEVRFQKFDRENPCIYEWFEAFAFGLIRSGLKRYSAYGVMHRVRFEAAMTANDEYKINNNLIPYYARKFLAHNPRHKGFFELRELATENREPDMEGGNE